MSAGAVFKLIANDGKADRMIMATKLLNQRIKDVMCARQRAGKADITPTLVDLERTHILFVNAHFKPFAAIGYEYNKVRPQSGNISLGSSCQFSIPQFGDFFNDMVVRVRLSQCVGNQGKTPLQVAGTSTSYSVFPFNGTDHYGVPDPTGTTTTYNLVDSNGNVIFAGVAPNGEAADQVNYANYVRYCEYPGNRLFTKVSFDVNGNPLDNYSQFIPVMLEKFCTPPHKRTGHDRLVGQEVPLIGYSGLCTAAVVDADYQNTPQGINKASANQSNQTVGLFSQNTAAIGAIPPATTVTVGPQGPTLTGTSVLNQSSIASLNALATAYPQADVSRELKQFVNGAQTPKPVQAPLEIWNKLRFWFNDDVRLSVASVSIPFGQRYINVEFAQQALMVFEVPSIYLETQQYVLGAPTIASPDKLTKTYTPLFQKFGVSDVSIEKLEMYINNIFVNPEVHDIYIKRIGFSLIRVYREHIQRCNQESQDEKLLSQLKWPIEYMFAGLRPVWNIKDATSGSGGYVTGGNQNQWRDWHRLTRQVDAYCDDPCIADVYITPTVATANSGAPPLGFTLAPAAAYLSQSSIGQVGVDQYWLPVSTIDTLTLTSHGITIFDNFNDTFFNQYMPFHYGGTALVTPDDTGAMFINMALFPRLYQPSGHLNISRARETYLRWTTSYVSAKTPADLIVVAVAINFLLITDGSAVLRYST